MNSTDLVEASNVYEALCIIFLSKHETKTAIEAKKTIKKLLYDRPDNVLAKNHLFKTAKLVALPEDDGGDQIPDFEETLADSPETHPSAVDVDVAGPVSDLASAEFTNSVPSPEQQAPKTIKMASPFYHHFVTIRKNVEERLLVETQESKQSVFEPNLLFCESVIDHLENKYMGYGALWMGFVLKGTGLCRLTNGVLENYNRFLKRFQQKKVRPTVHVVNTFRNVMATCDSYLLACHNQTNGTNKRKKPESESDDDGEPIGFDEVPVGSSTAAWQKKRNSKRFIPPAPRNQGFQQRIDTDSLKPAQPKLLIKKKCLQPIDIKIGSFDLNQNHLRQLEDRSGQFASWLSHDIIQAYLFMFQNGGIVLNCLYTALLHSKDSSLFDRLSKVNNCGYELLIIISMTFLLSF
jgi:hypothetical protein